MSDRDYYEILGLTPAADGAMVDQAYRHLARTYQSLAVTNPQARHLLDELNEAYSVIGAPRRRHQYDASLEDMLITKGMVKPVNRLDSSGDDDAGRPSRTLVDIVESERDIEETGEPLSAVIDILRGAHRPTRRK